MLPRIDPQDELVCLGHAEDIETQAGALAPPIVQTSLFAHRSLAELMEALGEEHQNAVYTRGSNPSVAAVEAKLAALERGEAARCFASGMAAVSAVMLGNLEAGDHVLFVNQTYGPTLELARHLGRFGVTHSQVLELDLDSIEAALEEHTRLIWIESPGTMLFRSLDVRSLATMARFRGILTAMDNSWSTPLFQKPLTDGVDLVVHSATKYLGGHSDVVAGAVVGSEEALERIFYRSLLLNGGILAPFDGFLLNRGLRTLPVRMRRHHDDGLMVASFLADHPRVGKVFHPGLGPDSPAPGLSGFSGLFSFEIEGGGYQEVAEVIDRLELFRIGVSWGGVESVVISPNRGDNLELLDAQGIPPGTIRLSIGLEGSQPLIADLEQALSPR